MVAPQAPGSKRARRAPLPTIALIVGITLCVLGVFAAAFKTLAQQLASDALVMRALAVTLLMCAFMLGRVGIRAAVGLRRGAALAVSVPLAVAGALMIVRPSAASVPYERGWAVIVPLVLGALGVIALLLSRWRVR